MDSDAEKQRLQEEVHGRIGILRSNAAKVNIVFR